MAKDHTCLETKIKNTSGQVLVCSFLPPHGITLGINETVSIAGDIFDAIRAKYRTGYQRAVTSLMSALDEGLLELISTPSPILEDLTTGESYMVTLDGGELGVDDPCYESVSE